MGQRLSYMLCLIVVLLTFGARSWASNELLIESGQGQAAGLSWMASDLHYLLVDGERQFELMLSQLQAPGGLGLGDLRLRCHQVAISVVQDCQRGELHWQLDEPVLDLKADLAWQRDGEHWQLQARGESWALSGSIAQSAPQMASLELTLEGFSLAVLPPEWLEAAGLTVLTGQLDGKVQFESGQLQAALSLSQGGFDSPDGSLAADGLSVGLNLSVAPFEPDRPFSLALEQAEGEWLFGSVYLPPPDSPLVLTLQGRWAEGNGLTLDHFELLDPDALVLSGRLALLESDEGWSVHELVLDQAQLAFPLAWARWLDGPASAVGFGGLETAGTIDARLDWRADAALQVEAEIRGVSLSDPAGRISVDQAEGAGRWGINGPSLELDWQALKLYGLTFDAASLALESGPDGVRLTDPLRLPLLDGAVVVEQIEWRPGVPDNGGFGFDARIEPLSLADLTRQLELPVFGGQLSGAFPGVRYADDVLSFTGGIDIQAFSGQISLADLAIERPFGTLPAVRAQLEFSRLDLLELTGAFNFGRMQGQLSGWARDLRLLNWRPVAMDARVFTHDDAQRRRISQRAVDNLSSLGGAGGALISGTVLRIFDDFPYRRAGLACRLSNNICHIDGVARHESGGFYIIEGRSLPRLDIIGHRRLVDWPQLMGQLEAMLEED